MVLLTVIAVATLLVAVVGATFAYFTASVGGNGNNTNNTSKATTVVLAGVNYEGTSVFTPAVEESYPGLKGVQTFTISLPENTPADASGKYRILLTPNVDSAFASDITYTLYKTTDATANKIERVKGDIVQTGNNYNVNDTLNTTGTPTKVKTGTLTGTTAITLEEIAYTGSLAETTYFLTIEYANTDASQNAAMGKTFSAKVTVELMAQ